MSRHVYLIGFMGSGKSTVGPVLASLLGRSFCDLDDLIEKDQKMAISRIFSEHGESYFRQVEARVLAQSAQLPNCVMALGGGSFISDANRALIVRHGISVWLRISLQLAQERCRGMTHRPLARSPEQFEALFHFRQSHYQLAQIHVEVEGKSPLQIAHEIVDKLTTLRPPA